MRWLLAALVLVLPTACDVHGPQAHLATCEREAHKMYPLPAQTIARGFIGLGKIEDGAASTSDDGVVAALARMTNEERTLTLIKAARTNPLRPLRAMHMRTSSL